MMNESSTIASTDVMSFVHVADGPRHDHNEGTLIMQVLPKHDSIGMGSDLRTTEICVNVKAVDLPDDDDETRAGVDIVVALDVSGSMSGRKLQLCKLTLEQLLRMLLPKDRFGLITYDTNAKVDLPAVKMTQANKDRALHIIKGLKTRNSTNISAAIGLAAQELNSVEEPNAVRSIFLLTDGQANCGVCDQEGLVELTTNCLANPEFNVDINMGVEDKKPRFRPLFKSRSQSKQETAPPKKISAKASEIPITMNCFGYGSDHNVDLLNALADAASGSYYFVEDDTSVATAFGDALGGIMSVVAQNAVLTLHVPAESSELGVKIVKVMHKEAIQRENGAYSVTVGDFFAEETRDVLFEIQLAQPTLEAAEQAGTTTTTTTTTTATAAIIPHVSVSMAYTDTLQKRPMVTEPHLCEIARPQGSTIISAVNVHVAAQWVRIVAAREMETAQQQAAVNNFAGARATIGKLRSLISLQEAQVRNHELVLMILEDLDEVNQDLQSSVSYHSGGHHKMSMKCATYSKQRCTEATQQQQTRNVYVTKKKKAASSNMQI